MDQFRDAESCGDGGGFGLPLPPGPRPPPRRRFHHGCTTGTAARSDKIIFKTGSRICPKTTSTSTATCLVPPYSTSDSHCLGHSTHSDTLYGISTALSKIPPRQHLALVSSTNFIYKPRPISDFYSESDATSRRPPHSRSTAWLPLPRFRFLQATEPLCQDLQAPDNLDSASSSSNNHRQRVRNEPVATSYHH